MVNLWITVINISCCKNLIAKHLGNKDYETLVKVQFKNKPGIHNTIYVLYSHLKKSYIQRKLYKWYLANI